MADEWKTAEEAAKERAERRAERQAALPENPVPPEVRCYFCAGEAKDRELWIHFLGKPRLPLCESCQGHAQNVVQGLMYGAAMIRDAYSKKRAR